MARRFFVTQQSDPETSWQIPSYPTISLPSPTTGGRIAFDTTVSDMKFANGTAWVSMTGGGGGGGGWTDDGTNVRPTSLSDTVSVGAQANATLGGSLTRAGFNVLDDAGAMFLLGGDSNGTTGLRILSAGSTGTLASPSIAKNNHILGSVWFAGYDTSGYVHGGEIRVTSTADWTASSTPAKMLISAGVVGTDGLSPGVTDRLLLDQFTNFVIGPLADVGTTATDGFLYVPAMNGPPTGDFRDFTGKRPLVVDYANKKLYLGDATNVWVDITGSGGGGGGGWQDDGTNVRPTTLGDTVSVGGLATATMNAALSRGAFNIMGGSPTTDFKVFGSRGSSSARINIYSTSGSVDGGATVGAPSGSGQGLGRFSVWAYDSSAFIEAFAIHVGSGNAWGASDNPADVTLSVGKDNGVLSQRLQMDKDENFLIGPNTTLGTTATSGFVYIPSMAGPPTGDPAVEPTNQRALVVDHTNKKLYLHDATTTWVDITGSGASGWTDSGTDVRVTTGSDTVSVGPQNAATLGGSLSRVAFNVMNNGLVRSMIAAAGTASTAIPEFRFYRAENTLASPNVVSSLNIMARMSVHAYDGSAYVEGARLSFRTINGYGGSDRGTSFDWQMPLVGTTALATRMTMDDLGNFLIGSDGALATSAANGFLHIPGMAGIPTGTATLPLTGHTAVVADTTNNELYFYDGLWNPASRPEWFLTPGGAILPNTNFPALTKTVGTNLVYYELDYDATTSEAAYWNFHALKSTNATITVYWKAAATTGDVVWEVTTRSVADAGTWDSAGTTTAFTADTAKGTTEQVNEATLTLTTPWTAGQWVQFKMARNTGASDTMTGDAKLLGIKIVFA